MKPSSVQEGRRGEVSPGMFVAVYTKEKDSRPCIGRVVHKEADNVHLQWYKGTWSGKWKLSSQGRGRNARPLTDTVSLETIILWGFELTSAEKLRAVSKRELQIRYDELDESA